MIDTLVQQIATDLCRFMIVADKGNLKENLDEMYFIIRTGSVKRIVKSYSADASKLTTALCVPIIIPQLFQVFWLAKCFLNVC